MITIDANAIAGELEAVRGTDLTAARCTCAACDASSHVAAVCTPGPGRVASSRARGERVIVLVTIRGITCVDIGALAALEYEV
jgi:hypothetical protein